MLLLTVLAVLTAPAFSIDLAPLVNGVLWPLAQPPLIAGLLWLTYKVGQLLHINIQAGQRALFETAFTNATNYAGTKLGGAHLVVSTNSAAISTVASYINQTAPGAVKALGLDKDANAFAAAILARLPQPATLPAAPAVAQAA